jgi:hypothetical protein
MKIKIIALLCVTVQALCIDYVSRPRIVRRNIRESNNRYQTVKPVGVRAEEQMGVGSAIRPSIETRTPVDKVPGLRASAQVSKQRPQTPAMQINKAIKERDAQRRLGTPETDERMRLNTDQRQKISSDAPPLLPGSARPGETSATHLPALSPENQMNYIYKYPTTTLPADVVRQLHPDVQAVYESQKKDKRI